MVKGHCRPAQNPPRSTRRSALGAGQLSANFTERGLTRNLVAGVLIDDTTFARRLRAQCLALIDSGQMRP